MPFTYDPLYDQMWQLIKQRITLFLTGCEEMVVQWNQSITTTYWDTSLPPGAHLDEIQKAEIVSKSKLVPSAFIKTHHWINHKQ